MEHIKSQTGLRGIAALVVVPAHIKLELIIPDYTETILRFFPSGAAVNVFFVLSGFILSYVYCNTIKEGINWKSFFIARFSRIYPLYFLLTILGYFACLIAGTSTAGIDINKDVIKTILQLLMVHSMPVINVSGWVGPSWSMCMEVLAYTLIFPLMSSVIGIRLRSSVIITSLVLAIILYEFLKWSLFRLGYDITYIGWHALLRISVFFTIGILFFKATESMKPLVNFCVRNATYIFLLVFAWHVLDRLVFTDHRLHSSWGWIILVLCVLKDGNSAFSRFLSHKVSVFLGLISYSIYLLHSILGEFVFLLNKNYHLEDLNGWVRFLLILTIFFLNIALAKILYSYVEIPGKRFFSNRLKTLL